MFNKLKKLKKINLNPMNLMKRNSSKKDNNNFVIRKEEITIGNDVSGAILYRKTNVIVVRPNINSILSGTAKKNMYVSTEALNSNVLINLEQWDSIDLKDVNGEVYNIKDNTFKFSVLKTLCEKQGNVDQIKFNIKVSNVK